MKVLHMTRRRAMFALVLIGGTCAVLVWGPFAGCSALPPVSGRLEPTAYRSQKLMSLAAEEAASIPDVDVRLTRQLNLADMQIGCGWKEDARGTLAAASKTLDSDDAKKLNDHARISGWVSVSQLARRAEDPALGLKACEAAVADMLKIEDQAKRCEYVMGLANELQYLKGKPEAAKLLTQAGPWTRSIDDLAKRRAAVVAFASALFNLDDYAGGQAVLRQDDEAAWRSQMLLAMATITPEGSRSRPAAATEAARGPASPAEQKRFYGRQLDYGTVFQNQSKSNTQKD